MGDVGNCGAGMGITVPVIVNGVEGSEQGSVVGVTIMLLSSARDLGTGMAVQVDIISTFGLGLQSTALCLRPYHGPSQHKR